MPITPIEIASMAPKSQEVTHYKVQESQRPMHEQALINSHIKNEIRHNNIQTVKTNQSENKEYRYDAKEKGNNSNTGSKQKKKQNNKETAPKDISRTGSIDIKI
jgi:hypothetical protein